MCPRTTAAWPWPLAIIVVGLALLGATWSAAIQGLDGLAVVAASEGQVAPGGYPLHALLGRLACALPGSSAAGRMALVSVVAGTWTLVALYLALVALTGSRWAAGSAALVLATGEVFWRVCSHASPWPLALALSATALWLGLRHARGRSGAGGAVLLGLCGGLALPGLPGVLALLVLALLPLARRPLRLLAALGGLALGLAPQVLMANAEGGPLQGLLAGLPRPGASEPWAALWRFVVAVPAQTGVLLWPLALLGATGLLLYRAGRVRPLSRALGDGLRPAALAPALGAAALLWAPLRLVLFEGAPDGIRHLLLPLLLLALAVGVGLAVVEDTWLLGEGREGRRRLWQVAVLVLLGLAAVRNHRRADVSDRYAVEDHGINCLSVARPGALVLGHGALLRSTVLHARQVLGRRPDVRYIDLDNRRGDPLRLIQREQRRGGTVYLARPLAGGLAGRWRNAFAAYPVGPLMRLVPVGTRTPEIAEVEQLNRRVFRGLLRRDDLQRPELDPDGARLRECYARAWRWIARELLRAGQRKQALRALITGQRWAPWLEAPGWLEALSERQRRTG